MHELTLARGLVSQAQRIAEQHRAGRIDEIVVRIGTLSGVEADLLARAFLVARMSSLAEHATLTLEECPLEIRCTQCGWRGPVMMDNIACVTCGAHDVDVIAGSELVLVQLELSQWSDIDERDERTKHLRDTAKERYGQNA